jgi:hypothetical protein
MAGDTRLEAENMTLGGAYRIESGNFASEDEYIGLSDSTGTATATFTGESGIYEVKIGYYDEADGESTLSVRIGGTLVDSWTFNNSPGGNRATSQNFTLRTIATELAINNGDVIEIVGVQNEGENARVDFIEFTFKSPPGNTAPALTGNPMPVNYDEDAPPVNVGIADLVVDDAEENVTSAKVEIVNAEETEELAVGIDLLPGLDSTYLNGVLTIRGTAPLSTYTSILRNITYRNSDDTPPSIRTIQFSVNDGEFDSNLLTQTVNITDLPENSDGDGDGDDNPSPSKLFKTPGNLLGVASTESSNLAEINLIKNALDDRFEINVFKVDDEGGTIEGIGPNNPDYIFKALENSTTLFGTTGDRDIVVDFTRLFSMSPGHLYAFVILPNNTRDSFLSGNESDFQLGLPSGPGKPGALRYTWSEAEDAYFLDWNLDGDTQFDDLRMRVTLRDGAKPILGSSFQGGFEGEVLDLTGLTGQVELVFAVKREAKYDNLVGFYKTEDERGTIRDEFGNLLSPGDEGYIQAAVKQWQNQPGITGRNGRTVTITTTVAGGAIYAPFIVVDGTLELLLDADPNNDPAVYFPYLGANSDGADHIMLLGDNVFGFEDLPNGGDNDFDDMVITTRIRSTTV